MPLIYLPNAHPTRNDLNQLFSSKNISDTRSKLGDRYSLGDAVNFTNASQGQKEEWNANIQEMKRVSPDFARKLEAVIIEALAKQHPITFKFKTHRDKSDMQWRFDQEPTLPLSGPVTLEISGPKKPPTNSRPARPRTGQERG